MARSPEGNGRGMMQAKKTAIREREREGGSRQEERVCLRRGENPRGERSLVSSLSFSLSLFSPTIPRERTSVKRRERKKRASERASERTHEQGMAVAVAAAALPPHH